MGLRVVSRSCHSGGKHPGPALAATLQPGAEIIAGRQGGLPVAVEDGGISREALSIRAGEDGWELRLTNRNGGVLHRWAQPAMLLDAGQSITVRWPRVGVRLIGTDPGLEHWVLLEADDYPITYVPELTASAEETLLATHPRPLTDPQRDALTTVFAEHLVWPPLANPQPMARETVGRKLGISYTGVAERLQGVQRKAQLLGSHQQYGLMEPDYLYLLVARGYLDPPHSTIEAEQIT